MPQKLRGYARRGFDQGLGRSLWFVDGADVRLLPRTIGAFPASRQPDLWAGLGLAACYAGGRGRADLEELRRAAGAYAPELAQGTVFAAKARQRAGNIVAPTELAAEVICGRSAAEAAALTDEALRDLPADRPGEPAFEVWRRRIQDHFRKERVDTMNPQRSGFFRRNATRLAAVALIAALYGFARLPTLPEPERQALVGRFAFTRAPLATPPGISTARCARSTRASRTSGPGSPASAPGWRSTTSTATGCRTTSARSTRGSTR